MVTRTPDTSKTNGRKAANLCAEVIRTRILEGHLSPGQRLIEAELLGDIGVGRSTLREAYLILDKEGLVELRHQRGAVVRALSRRDLVELFQLRECLEGYGAALAARTIEDGDNRLWLQRSRSQWQDEHVRTNGFAHMELNIPFHAGIIAMAGNERLVRTLQPLQIPGYRMQFLRLLDHAFLATSVAEHLAIAEAILAGKAAAAERLMRKHVRRAATLALAIEGLKDR